MLHGALKNELLKARKRYFGYKWLSLQLDLWTDRNMLSYICLNCAFVNEKFERINRVLASRAFSQKRRRLRRTSRRGCW
ncbi:MAG: hypothetical protein AAF449_15945, partial [Myxococcota bacterium]